MAQARARRAAVGGGDAAALIAAGVILLLACGLPAPCWAQLAAPNGGSMAGAAPNRGVVRVAIVPGSAVPDPSNEFWYGAVKHRLQAALPGLEVELRPMPSPYMPTASSWQPFMHDALRVGPSTVVVGHSSGAVAAMRYTERNKVAGLVLVAAYSTDLGLPTEKASGFFDAPWDWAVITANAGFIIQFASPDDFLVPFEEQRRVAAALGSDFRTLSGKGHFLQDDAPEIADAVIHAIRKFTPPSTAPGSSSGAGPHVEGG